MEVIELCQGEQDEAEEDGPGLPAVELVYSVHDCANEELDGGFGYEEGVCREYAAYTAIG